MATIATRGDIGDNPVNPTNTLTGFEAVFLDASGNEVDVGGTFKFFRREGESDGDTIVINVTLTDYTVHPLSTANAVYGFNVYPDNTTFDPDTQAPAYDANEMFAVFIMRGTTLEFTTYYPSGGVWVAGVNEAITFNETQSPNITIPTTSFTGDFGTSDNFSVQASGGTGPYTYVSQAGGNLPITNTGSFAVGSLSVGSYSTEVIAVDSLGNTSSPTLITLTVQNPTAPLGALGFSTTTFNFVHGTASSSQIVATNGVPSTDVYSDGPNPNYLYEPLPYAHLGMSRGAGAGELFYNGDLDLGPGDYEFSVTVRRASDGATHTDTFTVTIDPQPTELAFGNRNLFLEADTLQTVTIPQATGGTTPYVYDIPTPVSGFSLVNQTPLRLRKEASVGAGNYAIGIRVTDDDTNTVTNTVNVNVATAAGLNEEYVLELPGMGSFQSGNPTSIPSGAFTEQLNGGNPTQCAHPSLGIGISPRIDGKWYVHLHNSDYWDISDLLNPVYMGRTGLVGDYHGRQWSKVVSGRAYGMIGRNARRFDVGSGLTDLFNLSDVQAALPSLNIIDIQFANGGEGNIIGGQDKYLGFIGRDGFNHYAIAYFIDTGTFAAAQIPYVGTALWPDMMACGTDQMVIKSVGQGEDNTNDPWLICDVSSSTVTYARNTNVTRQDHATAAPILVGTNNIGWSLTDVYGNVHRLSDGVNTGTFPNDNTGTDYAGHVVDSFFVVTNTANAVEAHRTVPPYGGYRVLSETLPDPRYVNMGTDGVYTVVVYESTNGFRYKFWTGDTDTTPTSPPNPGGGGGSTIQGPNSDRTGTYFTGTVRTFSTANGLTSALAAANPRDIVRYNGADGAWLQGNWVLPANVWLDMKSSGGNIGGLQGHSSSPAHGNSARLGGVGVRMNSGSRLSNGRLKWYDDGVWLRGNTTGCVIDNFEFRHCGDEQIDAAGSGLAIKYNSIINCHFNALENNGDTFGILTADNPTEGNRNIDMRNHIYFEGCHFDNIVFRCPQGRRHGNNTYLGMHAVNCYYDGVNTQYGAVLGGNQGGSWLFQHCVNNSQYMFEPGSNVSVRIENSYLESGAYGKSGNDTVPSPTYSVTAPASGSLSAIKTYVLANAGP